MYSPAEYRKLEAERDALVEAAKTVLEDIDPLDQFISAPLPVVRLKTAVRKAEGRSK